MNYDYGNVELSGGFWKSAKDLNRDVSIYSVWERFKDTGRINAFEFKWKPGYEPKPHVYWDSDVVKWMEGACNIIAEESNDDLEEKINWLIARIEENQQPDGYFNIYFTVCEPEKRFSDRNEHELYCAGHLIEAACTHYHSTGSKRLLNVAVKYADYIEKVFKIEETATFTTPGHQEIELALARLYKATGEKRYIELSEFFLKKRGNNEKDEPLFGFDHYAQDYDCPENLNAVLGHAVRCLYMLCGMADCAELLNNKKLFDSCVRAYDEIVNSKMYITGGVGSTRFGEAFTIPYELSNETAYNETCASIALMLFTDRMCRITHNARYADTLERAMYNGMMSGISLDGKAYFYENPLEINLKNHSKPSVIEGKEVLPITQRKSVFDCSCCPPNLNRILSSIERFIYDVDGDKCYINQFAESSLENETMKVIQKTQYPWKGRVEIEAYGMKELYIRIPAWCDSFTLSHKYELKNGYACIIPDGKAIVFDMDMSPYIVGANPHVSANIGRVALQAGPIVYCTEGVDNSELDLLYIKDVCSAEVTYDDFFRGNTITLKGRKIKCDKELYTRKKRNEFVDTEIKFIPYYGFANRGESDMRVWMNYMCDEN